MLVDMNAHRSRMVEQDIEYIYIYMGNMRSGYLDVSNMAMTIFSIP
jgi:hypothetical protein